MGVGGRGYGWVEEGGGSGVEVEDIYYLVYTISFIRWERKRYVCKWMYRVETTVPKYL